jgi:hypothetical protein
MNFNIDTPEGMKNAIEWQNNLLRTITQGGRWVVPRSLTIFEVDHANKTIRKCVGGAPLGSSRKGEPIIVRVLKAAGWKVVGADGVTEINK